MERPPYVLKYIYYSKIHEQGTDFFMIFKIKFLYIFSTTDFFHTKKSVRHHKIGSSITLQHSALDLDKMWMPDTYEQPQCEDFAIN